MAAMRFAVLAALCLASVSAQAPACNQARDDCAASCGRDSLDVAAFLCRETVFGLLTSCSCAPAKPPAAEFALPSSSEIEGPFSDSSSASSSDYGFSTSSAQPTSSSSSSDGAGFLPRRFGPIFFPAGPVQPLFFPGQQPQDDPFAAARTAFLNDALARSGRTSQPSFVVNFDVQQPAEGMIFVMRDDQQGRDPRMDHRDHHDHPEDSDNDSDEMDMGPGCAIMTLATVAFFVGLIACCVRACLAACPRRVAALRSRQILVDCTAGELSSPLLVVEDADKDRMVTVVSARSA